MKFGAEDYLLKPVSEDELKQIVENVIEKKTQTKENDHLVKDLRRELLQSQEILRRQFARELVNREFKVDNTDLLDFQKKYSVTFESDSFLVLIFQIEHPGSETALENTEATDTILSKLEVQITANFKNLVGDCLCGYRDLSLIFILNLHNDKGLSFKELEHLHESAVQKITEYGNWIVTLCAGSAVNGFDLLRQSFEEADFARRDRLFRGCGKILEKRDLPGSEEELRYFDLVNLKTRIQEIFNEGDVSDTSIESLSEFSCFPALPSRVKNPDTILALFRYITRELVGQLKSFSFAEEDAEKLNARVEGILYRTGSIEGLKTLLGALYAESVKELLSSRRVKEYRPIRLAKEYIDEHYAENIDLPLVAKEAAFNPVYFSTLFKKETGTNFKEYLTLKRIEVAKQLLTSGNDTIMVISEKVGYKDVRYFSKIFTRTVGIKPHMYRKIYG